MKNIRIVFMGTPEFAVATLGSLLMNGYNVVGVVTAPDKPAGRGRKISRSPVKEFAEMSYLPVLQPVKLKDPLFIEALTDIKPDLFIVVAFRMLPEVIWKLPPRGTINLHASLLPHYRGAAPINHALINGEKSTGVTTFFINDQIDTGNLLLREEVQIFPSENAGDLHNRLMKLGARLVIKTIEDMSNNAIVSIPQSQFLKPGETPKQAPKIYPENCLVRWEKSSIEINNLVRGLSPSPCARSFFASQTNGVSFKIFESRAEDDPHSLKPGTLVSDNKNFLKIACGKGFLEILSIQAEGKRRMGISEFLRGFKISGFNVLSSPQA